MEKRIIWILALLIAAGSSLADARKRSDRSTGHQTYTVSSSEKSEKRRAKNEKRKEKSKKTTVRKSTSGSELMRITGDIKGITNHTALDVTLVYGKTDIVVEGSQKYLDDYFINVSNGVLTISYAGNKQYGTKGNLVIRGSVRDLGSVTSFGSGNIKVGAMDCTSSKLQSFGSGSISVTKVDCTGMQISSSGSGDITRRRGRHHIG